MREAVFGRRTVEFAAERRACVLHDLEVPHPQRAVRPGVVRVQLQRAIEVAPTFARIPLQMRLDRAVELTQVAERQGELEVRIQMLRIARARGAVGHGKLEQRLLSSFCARKAASTTVARAASVSRSVLARVRPSSAATRKSPILVTRFRLAESMGVQRLGPDQGGQEPHRSNARSRRNGSSKCRRPTNAVAWLPHCRMAPALAMPIGQTI